MQLKLRYSQNVRVTLSMKLYDEEYSAGYIWDIA